jgi:hypothetical protein
MAALAAHGRNIDAPIDESEIERARESFISESAALRYSSPFFSALAQSCAQDREILKFGASVRPGQTIAMFILLAAQFLVFRNPGSQCARYFPSVSANPEPASEAFPIFRAFCLAHRQELISILPARTVNTTLVDRGSYILPAVQYVAGIVKEPLSIIEIGCSAGLNLLFDRYHYDYGASGLAGDRASGILLRCKIIGGQPPIPSSMPAIAHRAGIDLIEVNCSDPQERLWMEAMLFPEWVEERMRLRKALALRADTRLRIEIGDALAILPSVIAGISGPICLIHSHSLGQWTQSSRDNLHRLLCELSRERVLHRIGIEGYAAQSPQRVRERLIKIASAGIPLTKKSLPCPMIHTVYENSSAAERIIAEVDGLASWIDWYG